MELVEVLQSNGADIEKADWQGKTALHHAVENGSTRVVKQLLSLKPVPADVLAMDKDGHMPLYYAIATHRGDEESWTFVLALLLLAKPANLSYAAYLSQPDHANNTALSLAASTAASLHASQQAHSRLAMLQAPSKLQDLLAKADKLDSSHVQKAVQKLLSPSGSAAVQRRSQAQPGAAQPGESLLQQAQARQRERMARAKARGGTAVSLGPLEQATKSMPLATLLKEQQECLQKLQNTHTQQADSPGPASHNNDPSNPSRHTFPCAF